MVLSAPLFHGEGYRKVWARLRAKGVRVDKDRVRRVMGRAGLLAPQRPGSAHGPEAHDGTIVTDAPDKMWGTDATMTFAVEQGTATIPIDDLVAHVDASASEDTERARGNQRTCGRVRTIDLPSAP